MTRGSVNELTTAAFMMIPLSEVVVSNEVDSFSRVEGEAAGSPGLDIEDQARAVECVVLARTHVERAAVDLSEQYAAGAAPGRLLRPPRHRGAGPGG